MSIFIGNYTESFLSYYANDVQNTKFVMYDNASTLGIEHHLFLDFYVNGNVWSHFVRIKPYELLEHKEELLRHECNKLLAMKRTTQLCVKYWTGVDIE